MITNLCYNINCVSWKYSNKTIQLSLTDIITEFNNNYNDCIQTETGKKARIRGGC